MVYAKEDAANSTIAYRGHLRVLGTPGSGKTSLLLERYGVLSGPGDGGGRLAIVTYSRRHKLSLTSKLLEPNTSRFGRTPVYTYHELALKILYSTGAGSPRLVADMEERVILARVLRRKGILAGDYASVAGSETFQRSMLRVFRILLQHGLNDHDLEKLIGCAPGARARDVFVLFREYRSYLDKHGFVTHYDAAWRAADLLAADPELNPLPGLQVLMIDDFNDVDAGQYRLIKALAPPSGTVEVNVFGDPCGARFRDRGTSDRYLKQDFPAAYQPLDIVLPVVCGNPAALGPTVNALLGEIGPEGLEEYSGAGGKVEVSLEIAEDELAESQAVADGITELILSGGRSPEEIAVVARDKEKYELVLSRALGERGLLLESGREGGYADAAFLRSLLALLTKPDDEFLLNAMISSPLYAKFRDYMTEKTGPTTGAAIPELKAIIREIKSTANRDKNGFDMREFLGSCLRPVLGGAGDLDLSGGSLSFLGALVEEWERYRELAKHIKAKPLLSEFTASSGVLTDRSAKVPAAGRRIGLYSCKELSAERFPVVFVVGCSEFLFPQPLARESYIPFGALQECADAALPDSGLEFYQTRSSDAHLKDEYALLLDTLTRAGEVLRLSSPQKHHGEYCPAPSQALTLIPRREPESIIQRSPAWAIRFADTAAGGARTSEAAALAKTEGGIGRLWVEPGPESRPMTVGDRPLSPSSLQTYTVCERKYFYTKVLKVKEEKSMYLTFGSLFHALLEKICKHNKTYEDIANVIRSDRLDKFIEDVIAGEAELSAGALITETARHRLRMMAHGYLELEAKRVDGFRVESTEELVKFVHADRDFVGVLDRLDRSGPDATVALDYKTGGGGIPKRANTTRDRILPGCKDPQKRLWQVPFYCRAVAGSKGKYPTLFAYYVIAPNQDPFITGVFVGEEDAHTRASVFEDKLQSKMAFLTRDEIDLCLDEAASVASEIFAERTDFPRTEDESRCRNCSFNYVCGRDN